MAGKLFQFLRRISRHVTLKQRHEEKCPPAMILNLSIGSWFCPKLLVHRPNKNDGRTVLFMKKRLLTQSPLVFSFTARPHPSSRDRARCGQQLPLAQPIYFLWRFGAQPFLARLLPDLRDTYYS